MNIGNEILILATIFAVVLGGVIIFFLEREDRSAIRNLREKLDAALDTKESKDAVEGFYDRAPTATKSLVDLVAKSPELALLLLTHPLLKGATPGLVGQRREDLIDLAKLIDQFLNEATDGQPNQSGTINPGAGAPPESEPFPEGSSG